MQQTFRAARTLCEVSGWNLTNLQIQKLLYIAHRTYLGRTGHQLVDMPFEAWDYGPVIPSVYRECRGYGNNPVRHAFFLSKPFEPGTPQYEIISQVYSALRDVSPAQLVAMTHMREGAWAQVYQPGVTGTKIPEFWIRREYQSLTRSQ